MRGISLSQSWPLLRFASGRVVYGGLETGHGAGRGVDGADAVV